MKQILVTVGTTNFDSLISSLDDENFYTLLEENGFTKLIFQIGTGNYQPFKFNNLKISKLEVVVLKLVPKFEEVIRDSKFVISHCGAGTILEGLKNKVNLIVVINPILMNNHQTELAEPLFKQNYILLIKNINKITEEIESIIKGDIKLQAYPEFDYNAIPNLIYEMLDMS